MSTVTYSDGRVAIDGVVVTRSSETAVRVLRATLQAMTNGDREDFRDVINQAAGQLEIEAGGSPDDPVDPAFEAEVERAVTDACLGVAPMTDKVAGALLDTLSCYRSVFEQ